MSPHVLFFPGSSIGPALANHLWQSTVFAAVVALLTLLLRRNQAQVRYWLWLTASLKFLIPFSLLVSLGGLLPSHHKTIAPQIAIYSAFDVAGQPFSEIALPSATLTAHLASWIEHYAEWLSLVMTIVWICGSVTVLLTWYACWRQVHMVLRTAIPSKEGREVEILRRLESRANRHTQIPLLRSQQLMEPGIFGIFRPVLLWPEQLSEQLEDEHIEAILAHEILHAQRHDNLTIAIHMLVEAAFWFHPLVWWIEARMVEEREHACDEAAVQLIGTPDTYAESLLKACRFCIESPLACVSGISGADLKKRIVRIMSDSLACKIDFSRKLLLVSAALLTIAAPIVFGQVNSELRFSTWASQPLAPPPPPPPPPRMPRKISGQR